MGGETPIVRETAARLVEVAGEVVGRRIVAVSYRLGASRPPWPGARSSGEIDSVDQGVVVGLDDGRALAIVWAEDGWTFGLGLQVEMPGRGSALVRDGLQFEADVSSTSGWSLVLGRVILSMGASWHDQFGEGESVWAIRLSMSNDRSVSVALGESDQGTPRYDPTSLLVFHETGAARSYRPVPEWDDAYGSDIAP
jgi:hypothetical protein